MPEYTLNDYDIPEQIGLRKKIERAINCCSAENGSDTPDFILAEYLTDCLTAYDKAVTAREKWYGRVPVACDPPVDLPTLLSTHLPLVTATEPTQPNTKMTIREMMETKLQENGLWPDEATAIMDAIEDEKCAESMNGRWKDAADGYPPQLFAVSWMVVQTVAAKWLEENKPMHWARPMFSDAGH